MLSYSGTTRSAEKSCARSAAAARIRACRCGSERIATASRAMTLTAPGGARKPDSPLATTSGRPPTAEAMTGTPHVMAQAEAIGLLLHGIPVGPVPDQHQRGRQGLSDLGEDRDHVPHPLHGTEVRDVHQNLVSRRRQYAAARAVPRWMVLGVGNEVRDDPDVAAHAPEGAVRLVP